MRIGWGTPPVTGGNWRLWLVCFYRRYPDGARGPDPLFPLTRKSGVACVQISVRGILVWGLGLGLVAYFTGALVLLRWYERIPHNRIGYTDLVIPTRWSLVSELRGQATIAQAYDDLKAGNFQPGFAKLRIGLARTPTDAAARLDLARIYVALRLRPVAERTLIEAFAHGYPGGTFVRDGFDLLAGGDHPDQSLVFCEKSRVVAIEAGASPDILRFIDESYVRTLFVMDRSAEALAFVRLHMTSDDEFARDVLVRHLLETKAHEEAVRAVEEWLEWEPASPEALRMAVRVYREAGRFTDMQATLVRLRSRVGAGPEFAAYNVVQHALTARRVETDEAVEDFLFRHGAKPRNLVMLASLLGDIGEVRSITRVEQDARERGFDLARIRLARLQALIVSRNWAEAAVLADVLAGSKNRLVSGEIELLQTLTFLVQTCMDGSSGAKSSLIGSISGRPGKMKLYRTVIESLLSAGQARTALTVLSFGEGPFPDSRYLAEARVRVTAQVAREDAAEQAQALVSRKEEPFRFPDVTTLLQAVARQTEAGRRDEALTLIRQHRRAAPGIFLERNPELARWEVRLPAESGDWTQLRFNLRAHLKTGALTADEVLAMALDWNDSGHEGSARLTVRELLKRDPGHEAALKIWSKWMPKPDPVQPDESAEVPDGEAATGGQ